MTEGTTMPAEREGVCKHCGSIAKLVCGIPCSCVGALKERDTSDHDAASKIEPEPEPRCERCKFYDRGECKRYPPSMNSQGSFPQHVRVQLYDWCGEFIEK